MRLLLKDIRNSFGFHDAGELPEWRSLVDIQKKSYSTFLSSDSSSVANIKETLTSIFPVSDTFGNASLDFVNYRLTEPVFDVEECKRKSLTYASDLFVTLRLTLFDKDLKTGEISLKSIKEQEVLLCSIPLMTDNATFVVNGFERVVVSQIHRSPGVFFIREMDSNIVSYSASIIPYNGSWISIGFDSKGVMNFKIDKKKKVPAYFILAACGYKSQEILSLFYRKIEFKKDRKLNMWFSQIDLNDCLSQYSPCNIYDRSGSVILEEGKVIGRKILKNAKDGILDIFIKDQDISNFVVFESDEILKSGSRIESFDVIESLDTISLINNFRKDYSSHLLSSILPYLDLEYEDIMSSVLKILRPGDIFVLSESERYFQNLFFNRRYYNLLAVGRHKINSSLYNGTDNSNESVVLTKQDIVETIKKLVHIKDNNLPGDDIDHLGNRRVRSVGELLDNQFRFGLLKIEKTVIDKMSSMSLDAILPSDLIMSAPINRAIKDFFMTSQLSQFMDQTNPLSELAHKRRISSLGVGGLNRDRAGFEVRDVHPTHYGRICPVETPEGANIGLIGSLATYATVNKYGFIETPYRKVVNEKITDDVTFLDATNEYKHYISQIDPDSVTKKKVSSDLVSARSGGEFLMASSSTIDFMDISPKQIVSVVAALIPFLENDDAKRALMGSNMQRQAVPLILPEAPLVGTGIESVITKDSGAVVTASIGGEVVFTDSSSIVIKSESKKNIMDPYEIRTYNLKKFERSNHSTCINQKPIVRIGDIVKAGQVIADGPAISDGEISLGRNLLVAFMPWRGYNFEDSIVISEKVSHNDVFTSMHIEEFETTVRDTRLGAEEITRDIPSLSAEFVRMLDESGIIHDGIDVGPGDILVGKVTPKSESPITAEEKLLRAIFAEKVTEVKDSSLRVPPGVFGTVVGVSILTRRGNEKDPRAKQIEYEMINKVNSSRNSKINLTVSFFDSELTNLLDGKSYSKIDSKTKTKKSSDLDIVKSMIEKFNIQSKDSDLLSKVSELKDQFTNSMELINNSCDKQAQRIIEGEDLPHGILKVIKVYVAIKQKLQPGDKMAGRHGNKGVVSKIVPVQDMPFFEDGTPVDIVLNPFGVASRMNIGQILETHLGFASYLIGKKVSEMLDSRRNVSELKEFLLDVITDENLASKLKKLKDEDLLAVAEKYKCGMPFSSPVFEGAKAVQIEQIIEKSGGNKSGQVVLYDGYSGERFDREITVGYIYMMKLHHLVENKIHARSIGPYSLVTQQPLGGRSHFGGQRFGEMECWALQAYGAAYTLQEMLTVKSDDTEGRNKMYESIVKGEMSFDCGIPESFNVMFKELRSLCFNIKLEVND